MSGLENIISRLNEDSSAECDKIIADAQVRAQTIRADAEKQAAKNAEKIAAANEKELELLRSKAVSAAALEERRTILSAKVELIEDVLAKALKKLHTLDTPSYFGVLKILASKNALEGKGIMMLNAEDLKRMPADFESGLRDIEVSKKPCNIKDGFILKYGDIEINCTFSAMLNSSKDDMKAIAGEILFG